MLGNSYLFTNLKVDHCPIKTPKDNTGDSATRDYKPAVFTTILRSDINHLNKICIY